MRLAPAIHDRTRGASAIRGARQHALALAITFALLVPLAIAAIVLHAEGWAPVFDMALIEEKVRDVGTAHTPLLGLVGRLGPPTQPGSHPGPLSFYLPAPIYRLLGPSAWALEASAAFVNGVAIA